MVFVSVLVSSVVESLVLEYDSNGLCDILCGVWHFVGVSDFSDEGTVGCPGHCFVALSFEFDPYVSGPSEVNVILDVSFFVSWFSLDGVCVEFGDSGECCESVVLCLFELLPVLVVL